MKKLILAISLLTQIPNIIAQETKFKDSKLIAHLSEPVSWNSIDHIHSSSFNFFKSEQEGINSKIDEENWGIGYDKGNYYNKYSGSKKLKSLNHNNNFNEHLMTDPIIKDELGRSLSTTINFETATIEKDPFFRNRRNVYSSLWTFASLNYIYADLVGLMDKNKLTQYQTGVVEGVKITPEFLTVAAAFMQIPLSNVFLPQIIKNDKTLRWVQIISGSIMTLVQAGTLFIGKPAPYYALFSAFEIGATAYITLDAIKWKPAKKRNKTDLRK